jgi:hypothetical protein
MRSCALISTSIFLLIVGVENVRYGLLVFGPTPHIDDWYFSKVLFDFVYGQRNLTYLLEPHNGHLSLASHLAFLAAYALANFDLSLVRWTSMIALLGLGGFFSAIILSDIRKASNDQPVSETLWLPAVVVPIMTIVSSKTGWEQFSVAAAVNSILCILWASLSLFLLERWLVVAHKIALMGVVFFATLATLSFGTGFVVWLCLVCQLALDPRADKRRRYFASAAFFAVGAGFALTVGQTNAQVLSGVSLSNVLGFAVIIAGTPIAPIVGGHPSIAIHAVLGTVLLLSSVGAVAWAVVSTSRAQASKYIAYIFFGFANVLAIAAARQWLGPEGVVASRYAVAGMPIVIGTCGILALMSANHFHGLFAFVAFAAAIVPPLLIANVEEHRLAQYRRANLAIQEDMLKRGDLGDLPAVKKKGFVTEQFATLIGPVRDQMSRHRLSIFRQRH